MAKLEVLPGHLPTSLPEFVQTLSQELGLQPTAAPLTQKPTI
jgi:hypothetical protein